MLEAMYPGRVLFQQQALARARRFQIETAIVLMPEAGKRVFKRALHASGIDHLQRMAANQSIMKCIPDTPLAACPCAMRGDMLEMAFIEGVSLKQKLIEAICADNPTGIEFWLRRYSELVTGFDHHDDAVAGPDNCAEIFTGLKIESAEVLRSGNIDQGFDHWIVQPECSVLIDYEWLLGFPVPLKYVFYRAAQLFFQDVPVHRSPRFRLRDMCAFFSITPRERLIFDQMETRFQRFVRHQEE